MLGEPSKSVAERRVPCRSRIMPAWTRPSGHGLADRFGGDRSPRPQDAVRADQRDGARLEVERLVEPGEVVAVDGEHDDASEAPVGVEDLPRQLDGPALAAPAEDRLAHVEHVLLRVAVNDEVLPVCDADPLRGCRAGDGHAVAVDDRHLRREAVRRVLPTGPSLQLEGRPFPRVGRAKGEQGLVPAGDDAVRILLECAGKIAGVPGGCRLQGAALLRQRGPDPGPDQPHHAEDRGAFRHQRHELGLRQSGEVRRHAASGRASSGP